jgi:hypothetical protein
MRYSVRQQPDGLWYVVDTGEIGSHVPGFVEIVSPGYDTETEAWEHYDEHVPVVLH